MAPVTSVPKQRWGKVMAVHLEAKVGQFFTHQASEKFIVLSEGATELAGSIGCGSCPWQQSVKAAASIVVNKRFVVYLPLQLSQATAKTFFFLFGR